MWGSEQNNVRRAMAPTVSPEPWARPMRESRWARPVLAGTACAALAATLAGCAVVTVAGATAGAAISVAGAVVGTGVKLTGKAIEKTVDLVTPGSAADAKPAP